MTLKEAKQAIKSLRKELRSLPPKVLSNPLHVEGRASAKQHLREAQHVVDKRHRNG
jgi:hypothetical protein